MDKRIILAVAGSGKTSHVINKLNLNTRALIITYTDANVQNLRYKAIAKFGYIPDNIQIMSYFSFATTFSYMPIFKLQNKTRGIIFPDKIPMQKGVTQDKIEYFQTKSGYLYGQRIAKLLCRDVVIDEVRNRIKKYFDYFIVDEVQDFTSHDFDLLTKLAETNINILYVGDFYQHTYPTSRDGSKRSSLFKQDYDKYLAEWGTIEGLVIDQNTLNKSYRCGAEVCDFVEKYLGISMGTHKTAPVKVKDIYANPILTKNIVSDDDTKKLFLQKSYTYNCSSSNIGDSKGAQFNQTCLVLSKEMYRKLMAGDSSSISPITRSKLYVGLTRSSGDTYIANIADPSLSSIKDT